MPRRSPWPSTLHLTVGQQGMRETDKIMMDLEGIIEGSIKRPASYPPELIEHVFWHSERFWNAMSSKVLPPSRARYNKGVGHSWGTPRAHWSEPRALNSKPSPPGRDAAPPDGAVSRFVPGASPRL